MAVKSVMICCAAGLLGLILLGGTASAKRCNGWQGEFSGNKQDLTTSRTYPVSARKCFKAEAECRRWVSQQTGDLRGGTIRIASCRKR